MSKVEMKYSCISLKIIVNVLLPTRYYSSKPPWKILFFGTDQFSLYTLKLLDNYHSKDQLVKKLDVVTSVKQNANIVQKYAEKSNLSVYNWPNITTDFNYDVGLVVSFGYLIPAHLIARFPYGILNVHASLLPRWRGAAPIIHAIANGDKQTGVTVMRIKPHHFDVGEILMQDKLTIADNMEMLDLHQSLGKLGAKLLVKTLENLPGYIKNAKPQCNDGITYAPKITPEFATVRWNKMTSVQVYNLFRALKGYLPLMSTWQGIPTKIIQVKLCSNENCDIEHKNPGYVKYDKNTKSLKVLCADRTIVTIENIGIYGKRTMNAIDFNNGFLKKTVEDLRYLK